MTTRNRFNNTYLVITFLLVVAFVLGGCAQPTTVATVAPPTEVPTAPVAPPTEVPTAQVIPPTEVPTATQHGMALILGAQKDDHSWNEAAYNSLMALKGQGVRVAYSEKVAEADAARIMRDYIAQGYDIIIAHSFTYQDAVFQVATEYPNVNFGWPGGIKGTAKNVADYDQPFYEPAYLVGILAAYVSKTGSIGALYGFDIPVCHAMGEAFLAGAQSIKPDMKLTVTAVGSFDDVALAKEAALAQADTAGVDFWVECGEGPSLGAIEAAREKGGYVTGYVGDMSALGPDVVLSSIVWNLAPLFQQMYDQTAAGTFDNPWIQLGIKDGAFDVPINPALSSVVPAEATTKINEAIAAIKDGTLVVPYIPASK
jgi:basic membrane protein A